MLKVKPKILIQIKSETPASVIWRKSQEVSVSLQLQALFKATSGGLSRLHEFDKFLQPAPANN